MDSQSQVVVTHQPLSIDTAFSFVENPEHGAAASFIGKIRNYNQGKAVTGVSYDCFAPLTKKIFLELCEEAQEQWGKALKFYIAHRTGKLNVSDIAVIITVSSPHRDESFKACRYLIEEIKHRCPIWKQEHYVDGNSEWVKGHALCAH